MSMNTARNVNVLPVMGSSNYFFTMARFYAGLFGVPPKPILSDT